MSPKRAPVTNIEELNTAIAELELKAEQQKEQMLTSFDGVKESLKPMNLLKQTVHSTFSPDKKSDLVGTALGLGSGLLGRKLLFGSSSGILGKLLGAAVEFGLGGIVAKNADRIKEKGSEWLDHFLPRKKKHATPILRSSVLRSDPASAPQLPGGSKLITDPEVTGANFFPKN